MYFLEVKGIMYGAKSMPITVPVGTLDTRNALIKGMVTISPYIY
jgi:hypothetical protein